MNLAKKFDPGTAVAPTSTVEISISCRNLLDKDILSKSDPCVVVYHRPRGSHHWVEFLRTETIKDNLNPDFASKITMEYRFEEQQPLRFEVYDIDTPSLNLAEHDFLGFVECTLAQVVSAGSQGLTLALNQTTYLPTSPQRDKKTAGTIILLAEELASLKDEVTLKLGGSTIGSMTCCFIPPSVFYVLSKVNESGNYVVVHRSERVSSQDPTWLPTTKTVRSICNGDKDRGLKIEVYGCKMNGNHSLIGHCFSTLNTLITLGTGGIKLVNIEGSEISSTLLVLQCKVSPIYTFVDYIQNGTQIHCCFSIDFTSSNGDPGEPGSLHHFSPSANKPNPYEQAIQSVGDIIQDYDSNKLFAVHGFGARIPPLGNVSHNFFVTLTDSPYCYGIPGVLEGYRNCIRQIQLYGPTNFAPIVKHVAELAAQNHTGEHYFVLLIVTDGVITDMPQTKEAIVNASVLPISIIIVGVGGADFEAMEELDGDSVKISYNGRPAARDIVQFVPYRDAYSWMVSTVGPGIAAAAQQPHNPYGPNAMPPAGWANNDATQKMAQIKLAQEVLAEIPEQLTGYMKSKGLYPKRIPSAASAGRNA